MAVSPVHVRARVAEAFHDEYESLAVAYGWETQEASRKSWAELPVNQRQLMVHVIGNLEARGVITLPDADGTKDCKCPIHGGRVSREG